MRKIKFIWKVIKCPINAWHWFEMAVWFLRKMLQNWAM